MVGKGRREKRKGKERRIFIEEKEEARKNGPALICLRQLHDNDRPRSRSEAERSFAHRQKAELKEKGGQAMERWRPCCLTVQGPIVLTPVRVEDINICVSHAGTGEKALHQLENVDREGYLLLWKVHRYLEDLQTVGGVTRQAGHCTTATGQLLSMSSGQLIHNQFIINQ
ncbi:hypothetical protein Baya_12472 [Bagarius yarrelli]|uniref:Uncharacterized protein n=1 Tax=Bagarius yarrelli TaxID=175774 RepID=A0A556V3C5_BAGYA|nr:hypothetical protein Baya_12472 [Bagarius yarrelli]